jgi:hypothetical protein
VGLPTCCSERLRINLAAHRLLLLPQHGFHGVEGGAGRWQLQQRYKRRTGDRLMLQGALSHHVHPR